MIDVIYYFSRRHTTKPLMAHIYAVENFIYVDTFTRGGRRRRFVMPDELARVDAPISTA